MPAEGCDYTAGFRLGMGEEDLPEEQTKRLEVLLAEHPNHPSVNVKPKTLLTEQMAAEDGELNF